jgi:hypothetical protein
LSFKGKENCRRSPPPPKGVGGVLQITGGHGEDGGASVCAEQGRDAGPAEEREEAGVLVRAAQDLGEHHGSPAEGDCG